MPLPAAGQAWPPADVGPITAKHAEWNAWYVGDAIELYRAYSGAGASAIPHDKVAQRRGGVVGALARMWWGRPIGDLTKIDDDRLHMPIAADMCQASADLLYAEPPTLGSDEKPIQAELDLAIEGGLFTALSAGAEIGAALGDTYYRVTWDASLSDRSFITRVDADAALPEFRWGRLVAVTFWWTVRVDGQTMWRHLERHELDSIGNGVIFHGLYQGTVDQLGQPVPLTEHSSTAGLVVDAESKIDTQTPGLAVRHVPNKLPQRRWRSDPKGASLGRSDLDGIESLMDKLDMVYSSWMRDIRLAKSRIIVPAYMLESGGAGQGAFFDTDQDVFTRVNAAPREDGKAEITPQQFAIRHAEHAATIEQLINDILRTAGYSTQTFGEDNDGAAMTATEVTAKDRRSALTRDRKIRLVRPELQALLVKKLTLDKVIFGKGAVPTKPLRVDFVDVTQADPEALARTNLALFQAQSASAEVRVRMQHPDWDEKQVKAEAAAVLAEFSVAVPDPGTFRPGVDDPSVGSEDAGQP